MKRYRRIKFYSSRKFNRMSVLSFMRTEKDPIKQLRIVYMRGKRNPLKIKVR